MNSLRLRAFGRALLLLIFSAGDFTVLPVIDAATSTTGRLPLEALKTITKSDLAGDRRFTLKGWKGDLKGTGFTDLAGNDIASILAPKSSGGMVTLSEPTRPFVVKSKAPQLVTLTEHGDTILPGGLVVVHRDDSGVTPATSAIWFRLVCSLSPSPVPWNQDEADYVAQMKFAVRPTDGSPASITLPAPITVSLDFEGIVAKDVPDFTITQAGLDHQKVVELRFRPSTSRPKLKVRSTISDSDVTIEALPRLELRPERTEFLGFGLETMPVALAQMNPDGEPAVARARTVVDVQVRGAARREGAEVSIPSGAARTEFRVRSAGLGKVVVDATVGALTASTAIMAKFPLGPLIAALFGGAVGGWSRRWARGARKRSAMRHVVEGTVVGAVAFVAGVLGVGYLNLPAAVVATEAGAFLSGVLGGFAGATVLAALAARGKAGAE